MTKPNRLTPQQRIFLEATRGELKKENTTPQQWSLLEAARAAIVIAGHPLVLRLYKSGEVLTNPAHDPWDESPDTDSEFTKELAKMLAAQAVVGWALLHANACYFIDDPDALVHMKGVSVETLDQQGKWPLIAALDNAVWVPAQRSGVTHAGALREASK